MIIILNIQLTILLIIAVGYGITKAGIFAQKTRADLTDIVIYVVLPCNIFNSFQSGVTPDTMRQSVIVLLAAFGLQLLVYLLNKVIYFRIPPERSVVLKYATITNNAAFMGLPVIGAVFGPTGVLYGAVFLIPMRIFMWTMGLSLFTNAERKKRVMTLATHPCMWAVVIGFGCVFAPFEFPPFLLNAIAFIGECTRVLPMFIIGSILASVKPKDILDKQLYYYSFFRLAAIPAIMFGAMTLLRVDPLVTGVAVLSSAMPSAVATAMLAEKYGQDAVFGSKVVFVSTMLSIVTLPSIAAALNWLLPL